MQKYDLFSITQKQIILYSPRKTGKKKAGSTCFFCMILNFYLLFYFKSHRLISVDDHRVNSRCVIAYIEMLC